MTAHKLITVIGTDLGTYASETLAQDAAQRYVNAGGFASDLRIVPVRAQEEVTSACVAVTGGM